MIKKGMSRTFLFLLLKFNKQINKLELLLFLFFFSLLVINSKNHISSESESSSSTEIEVSRKSTFSPNTIRKRKMDKQLSERLSNRASNCCDSDDEDATFNELMGKFDESYIYEKETDILSDDSDQTECASDLDTGQDGGDNVKQMNYSILITLIPDQYRKLPIKICIKIQAVARISTIIKQLISVKINYEKVESNKAKKAMDHGVVNV